MSSFLSPFPNLSKHLAYFSNPKRSYFTTSSNPGETSYPNYSPEISLFIQDLKRSGYLFEFDWTKHIDLYQTLLADQQKIATMDANMVRQILTYMIRQERTLDGFIGKLASNGTLLALLRRVETLTSTHENKQTVQKVTRQHTDKKAIAYFALFLILLGFVLLSTVYPLLTNDLATWKQASVLTSQDDLSQISKQEQALASGIISTSTARPINAPFDLYIKYLAVYDSAAAQAGATKTQTAPIKWELKETHLPDSVITFGDNSTLPLVFLYQLGQTINQTTPPSFWLEREEKHYLDGTDAVVDLLDQTEKFNGFINGDVVTAFGRVDASPSTIPFFTVERLCKGTPDECLQKLEHNSVIAQIMFIGLIALGLFLLIITRRK